MNAMETPHFSIRARFVGTRIEIRSRQKRDSLDTVPEIVIDEKGRIMAIFRFGVVVFVGYTDIEENGRLATISDRIAGRFELPETEELEVRIDPSDTERIDDEGSLVLNEATPERLLVGAFVLAKSVVLAHYETRLAPILDRVERLGENLQSGHSGAERQLLLQEIGQSLLIQTRTVGRVEIAEKPDFVWDDPDLDRLYVRLAAEYELRDRDVALTRKLDLISKTSELYLDLIHNRQSLRVEWYIVILILFEIFLSLYSLFFSNGGGH
ncbi:MAG: RMD1 family protein [Verrucomicrobiae bacterium]|nr:RMD1 family protein [Verrucomicrobiae bacterium]MCB1088252.1 RMD1 family protein [Verrucomicrobiae bacterium]